MHPRQNSADLLGGFGGRPRSVRASTSYGIRESTARGAAMEAWARHEPCGSERDVAPAQQRPLHMRWGRDLAPLSLLRSTTVRSSALMSRSTLLVLVLCLSGEVGCAGASLQSGDASVDVASDQGDAAVVDVAADDVSEVAIDAPVVDGSVAGRTCTAAEGQPDLACGAADLVCTEVNTRHICSNRCTNNAAQANEQKQCGDALSTCLTMGEGAAAVSLCLAACRPRRTLSPMLGACAPGFVCTGYWYTHAGGRPDATGCFPFCAVDEQCGAGLRCNPRTGRCSSVGVVMTRQPDGTPCDATQTTMDPGDDVARSAQCRGICLTASSGDSRGVCASLVNARVTMACPDDPGRLTPNGPIGSDDLGMCIRRGCASNADCVAPLVCRYSEDRGVPVTTQSPSCQYPTSAQPEGISGDGGAPSDA